MRIRRSIHERLAGLHPVALVEADVLAAGDQVLLGLAVVGANDDLPHALDEPTHFNPAIDLGDDRLLLRLARLEQLGHPRQTAGDVLGLGGLARDLRDDVGREDVGAVGDVEVGAHRERIAVPLGARRLRRVDDDAGLQAAIGVLDDDLAREARDLVELLAHGHAFHDVLVLHLARELGQDRVGERIPLDEDRPRLDPLLRLDLQLGAVHDRVALALPPALVGHADLAVTVGGHEVAVAVHDGAEVVELHHARALRLVLGRLDDAAGRAADVERPPRKLGAGLADGLRRDDADGLAQLGQAAGAEVTPVAEHADAALGVAGEPGADAHALEARVLDLLRRLLDDFVVGLDDDLLRQGVADVFRGHPAQDAVPERLDDIAALDQRCRVDVLHRSAVVFADDDVLGDVDEPARQVAGVGRLQRRIGETLAGAVRGREVLQHGEAFAEVRRDRRLDDLARGLGHETAHAGQLADLLLAAPRAGVGHHVDRVELAALLAALELAEHLLRDELGGVRPDVDDLVVALAVGDDAVLILLLDLVDLLARLRDEPLLRRRDVHVVDADRQTGQRGVPEAEVFQLVEELHRLLVAEHVVAAAHERGDLLLLQLLVHEAQGLGDHLVEQRAAHRGLEELAVPAQADPRLEIDVLVVVGDPHFLRVREQAALAAHRALRRAEPLLGQVVDAEDHVLRGHGDRRAVGRRQDVVGREHQHLRLELGLHRQRHVDGHLVAVEVGVECRADQRGDLDGLALDEDRLEGLDAKPVERRRAVQQHRVLADDVVEDVPHLGTLLLHVLLGGFDGRRDAALLQLPEDEGLEELQRHLLGQAALVQLEVRPDHDDGAAGIIHALAEQILTEPALLALQRIGQRFQRPVVGAGDDAAAAPVVEQRVDGFLEHPLLVADDDLRRLEVHQPLQPVVPVDDAAIEVVQVRGREPTAVERHERAQLRRDHRDDLEDHPVRLVAGFEEGLDDLQPLDDFLALLDRRLPQHLGAQVASERVQVHVTQQLADGLGAHADLQRAGAVLLLELANLVDADQVLLLDAGDLVDRLDGALENHVLLEVEDLLQLAQRHVEELADAAGQPLEEPHVADRRGQLDVAHALATHARARDLDAALVAHHAGELHAFVLAARALVVLGRPEDARAEQAVTLGLERPVVDGLRLLHLAVRPPADLLGRRQLDPDRVKRDGLRMPIEDAPQVLGRLVLSDQAAERPIRQHSVFSLSFLAVFGHQLDVEREGLKLLHQHVERLRRAGLEEVLPLDDRLVNPVASLHVV